MRTSERVKKYLLIFCWGALFAALFLFFLKHVLSSLDPDLGWHLRVGQDITQSGIPRVEWYTYPTLGESWVDHEWLGNLLLFSGYSACTQGYLLLSIVFAFIVTGTLALATVLAKKYFASKAESFSYFIFSAVLLAIAANLLGKFFGVRLQVLSWLFVLILVWILAKTGRDEKNSTALFLPVFFWLWANLHGSFVLGLGFFGIFLLSKMLSKGDSPAFQKKLFAIFVFSVLATLINPYGTDLWELILKDYTGQRYYLEYINEWLPVYAAPYVMWTYSAYLSAFVVFFVLGWSEKLYTKKDLSLLYLFLTALFFFASIQARRFAPFFIFASFPLILKSLLHFFPLGEKAVRFLAPLIVLSSILFSIFSLSKIASLPFDPFNVNKKMAPHDAVSFLKNSDFHQEKIFNFYAWGGYLNWVWQDKKIFIDGRMPQKPLRSGISFLEEYNNFFENDLAKEKMEAYGIEVALLPPNKTFLFKNGFEAWLYRNLLFLEEKDFQRKPALYQFLENACDKKFQDEVAVVYRCL